MTPKRLRFLSLLMPVAVGTTTTTAAATTPSRIWRAFDRVLVRCTDQSEATDATAGSLCTAIVAEARRGSPCPVEPFEPGSAAARSPRSLLLEAEFAGATSPRQLRLSVRRAASLDDSEGARTLPPVAMAESVEASAAVLAGALDRALPWRRNEHKNERRGVWLDR